MTHNKINKECSIKECLLQDREEDISLYISQEIEALIQRLEARNPDVHSGCLHMMVKSHLEYESLAIFSKLVTKYNPETSKEMGVA